MRRIHRERRQHRVDARLEDSLQLAPLGGVEVVPVLEVDPGFFQTRGHLFGEDRRVTVHECAHLLANSPDRLERVQPVR